MSKDLIIHGPIPIPFQRQKSGSAKHITTQDVVDFWVNPAAAAIGDKQGCYVFALRAAKGYRVWYVGKATKSFRQECFTHHKLSHYNAVLFDGRKGTPVVFAVAPHGHLRKVSASTCDTIETFLIQAAYTRNPGIKNRQKTKMPNWTIAGVVRQSRGAVSEKARAFKTMMGLD